MLSFFAISLLWLTDFKGNLNKLNSLLTLKKNGLASSVAVKFCTVRKKEIKSFKQNKWNNLTGEMTKRVEGVILC